MSFIHDRVETVGKLIVGDGCGRFMFRLFQKYEFLSRDGHNRALLASIKREVVKSHEEYGYKRVGQSREEVGDKVDGQEFKCLDREGQYGERQR